MRAIRDAVCASTAAILLSACGGGGGSSDSNTTNTATGVFKDANVTGLGYHSGSRSGTTEGDEVITPVDLGAGNSVASRDIVNRVRFLLFLDSDDDPDNGIQISDDLRDVADNWNLVDFTRGDLGNELIAIASDVQSIDGDATVPSSAKAEDHFSATLRRLTSGAFIGTFNSDRSGRFVLLASAATGEITRRGYNETASSVLTLTSNSAVTRDTRRHFVSGTTSDGAEYSGSFDRSGNVAGDWQGTTISGDFAGTRISGGLNADFRFAGTYQDPDANQDTGVYAIDIHGTDAAGIADSVVTEATQRITGTISNGTDLDATTADGTRITGSLETPGDSLTSTTQLNGTWNDGTDDGTFSGDGCRLNG